MRKGIVARLFFSGSLASAVAVWAACSGSDKQDVIGSDSGADTGSGENNNDEDSGSRGDDSGNPGDTGTPDTGVVKIYDAGTPNVIDAGDIDGGIPCVIGGEPEVESNDSTLLANELNPTRCGVIRIDALDAGESDFLKFTLADASSNFYLQYAGEVSVLVETDGSAPVDISQGSPQLTFKKGQPYFVEVKSKTGKQQVWRVTLFQE